MDKKFIPLAEAASRVGIPVRTLRYKVAQGDIAGERRGRLWFVAWPWSKDKSERPAIEPSNDEDDMRSSSETLPIQEGQDRAERQGVGETSLHSNELPPPRKFRAKNL